MRAAVIGCGAIGTALSVALARGGAQVYAITRRTQGCRPIEAELRGFGSAEVSLCDLESVPKDLDVLVFATKAYDVADAVSQALSHKMSARLAVSVQNGLGPLEIIEDAYRSAVGALIYIGSMREGECRATYTGGKRVVLGCRGDCDKDAIRSIAETLASSGLQVDVVRPAEFEGERWLKLAVNSAINPLTLLAWSRNGVIASDPLLRETASSIALETGHVAEGLSVLLPDDPVEATLRTAVETGNNCSSTVQDVASGRRTELDYINRAVWERSRGLNFRAALNLLAYEAGEAASSWLKGRRSPCEGWHS
ncbi:MAG: ketopantoate reductase family protein [Acidilobus sp.]